MGDETLQVTHGKNHCPLGEVSQGNGIPLSLCDANVRSPPQNMEEHASDWPPPCFLCHLRLDL